MRINYTGVPSGMVTELHATAVLALILANLKGQSWFRGLDLVEEANGFSVRVRVNEVTPEILAIIPSTISEVPVRLVVVGADRELTPNP